MSRKSPLATLLLLPFIAISTLAHAGQTITDKAYWPNEARSPNANNPEQTDWRRARAMETRPAPRAAEPQPNSRQNSYRYQGGPKSGLTSK